MKRLALFVFCTAAYAGEPCKDGMCQIEEPELLKMRASWQQMKEERDAAWEAYFIMRAKARSITNCEWPG